MPPDRIVQNSVGVKYSRPTLLAATPGQLAHRLWCVAASQAHCLFAGRCCCWLAQLHDMGRVAFMEGEEAAWEDLEEIYEPAADAGELPLRLYAFVPLTTW